MFNNKYGTNVLIHKVNVTNQRSNYILFSFVPFQSYIYICQLYLLYSFYVSPILTLHKHWHFGGTFSHIFQTHHSWCVISFVKAPWILPASASSPWGCTTVCSNNVRINCSGKCIQGMQYCLLSHHEYLTAAGSSSLKWNLVV